MTKNKVLLILLSAVIAFSLWLYVITVVSPESEETFYNVPVVLQGEALLDDQNLMLMMEEKPTVTLTLTGNRTDLNKLNSSNITVTVDLARIYEPGEHELQYSISYPGDIASGAISVKSREPGNLKLTVERMRKDVEVPVYIETEGSEPAKGFEVMETTLDRENILITGPASVVDQIAMARIEVDYSGRKKTFGEDFFITLCDAEGNPVDSKWVEVDYSSVFLTTIIHQVKVIPLDVEILDGGGATKETSNVTLNLQNLRVSGSEEDMKKLDELLVDGVLKLGTIDLAQYPEDGKQEFDIKGLLPSGVSVVPDEETGDVVEKVTATIKFPELATTEVTITILEPENVPQGVEAEILTEELTVKIRGPKEQIEKLVEELTEESVKIVVDFSTLKPGTTNAVAQIVLPEAYADAGALGTYTVDVSVVASEEND